MADPTTVTKAIRRLRRAPHLCFENQEMYHAELELQIEPGVGLTTGQGSEPLFMLRASDDGGVTWSNERTGSLGKIGEYYTRVVWRRLGSARDRVYEVSISDPVRATVTDAFVRVQKGTA